MEKKKEKQNYKELRVVCELTPNEWHKSFDDKVVLDSSENLAAVAQKECYCGHWNPKKRTEFVLFYHKEYQSKVLSLNSSFIGRLERDKKGCRVVGVIDRRWSQNLFLLFGIAICLMCAVGSVMRQDWTILSVSVLLAVIFGYMYISRPKRDKERYEKALHWIGDDPIFKQSYVEAHAAAEEGTDTGADPSPAALPDTEKD